MSEYSNTNSGALYKNDKEGNDKRPEYKGKIDVEGVIYYVSSWIRTAKGSGEKFMSLKLEKKDGAAAAKKPAAATPAPEDDDDLPF